MRGLARISCFGALLACAGGVVAVAAPASAQGSYSPYDESPAAALARYVRALAQDPKDFDSLIGAGRAALELGDTQAAAGFFARADAVDPRSPLPQAGMGAVSVANGDPKAAMPYFTRAQQLGATQTILGCDRGLAYDLLGQQAKAQTDYRAALSGADRDKARRRLALSLAISGDKAGALAMLAPLSAKGDSAVPRIRAFILALTGDTHGAMTLIDAALPQGAASVAPFVQRLASLAPGQKAAAVDLGMFPDSNGGVAYAAAPAPAPSTARTAAPSTVKMAQTVSTDRLSGIDALLRTPAPAPAAQPVWQQPPLDAQPPARPQPVQAAYVPKVKAATAQRVAAVMQPKIWLELSSGRDADALSDRFSLLKARNPSLFKGIPGYVAQSGNRTMLVVGPFRGNSDAEFFAADLQDIGIGASRWTNSSSDRIVPIAEE
jgi:Flp pilus assembly protein TadD